jgi:putative aldouronate transport system substrate-binding protein
MSFKRVVSVLLFAAMVITFAGCGGKTGSEKPYQIDWYFVGDPQLDVKEVQDKVNEYVKDEINISLELHPLDWSGIREKINIMAAGGEKFDITFTDLNNYHALAAKNAFLPLGRLLDQHGRGIKEALGEHFLEGSRIKGENYAIPVNKEKGHHYGILYQADIAEKHGLTEQIESIKSLEDLYPVLEIIKEKEPDLYPFQSVKGCDDTYMLDFEIVAYPAAFYADSKDGKVVNFVDTPEFLEAAKKIRERYEKGYLAQGGSLNQSSSKFFIRSYALKPGKDVEMSAKTNWKQVDLTKPRMQFRDTMGAMLAISKTSEKPELVMKFLNKAYTDPYLINLIVYGIEGKHYTKIDENKVKMVENSGYDYSTARWQFCNVFNQYLLENDDPKKNDNLIEYNERLAVSEYLGFNPDTTSIKTQMGACLNVQAEFEQQIADGVEDAEVLVKKYREKLRLAGADDIVNEIQRQYNEWAGK